MKAKQSVSVIIVVNTHDAIETRGYYRVYRFHQIHSAKVKRVIKAIGIVLHAIFPKGSL